MSNEILLDKERLITISNGFENVLDQAVEATQLATDANGGLICFAASRAFHELINGIRKSICMLLKTAIFCELSSKNPVYRQDGLYDKKSLY